MRHDDGPLAWLGFDARVPCLLCRPPMSRTHRVTRAATSPLMLIHAAAATRVRIGWVILVCHIARSVVERRRPRRGRVGRHGAKAGNETVYRPRAAGVIRQPPPIPRTGIAASGARSMLRAGGSATLTVTTATSYRSPPAAHGGFAATGR